MSSSNFPGPRYTQYCNILKGWLLETMVEISQSDQNGFNHLCEDVCSIRNFADYRSPSQYFSTKFNSVVNFFYTSSLYLKRYQEIWVIMDYEHFSRPIPSVECMLRVLSHPDARNNMRRLLLMWNKNFRFPETEMKEDGHLDIKLKLATLISINMSLFDFFMASKDRLLMNPILNYEFRHVDPRISILGPMNYFLPSTAKFVLAQGIDSLYTEQIGIWGQISMRKRRESVHMFDKNFESA